MTREQIIHRVERWTLNPRRQPRTDGEWFDFMQDVALLVEQSRHWAEDAKFLEELRKRLVQKWE